MCDRCWNMAISIKLFLRKRQPLYPMDTLASMLCLGGHKVAFFLGFAFPLVGEERMSRYQV